MQKTQVQKVVDHIETYGSINVIEAITHYGITQLGKCIFDLKETPKAMMSVPAPDIGGGYVRYVADWDARQRNLMCLLQNDLHTVRKCPRETAKVLIDYAARFTVLNHEGGAHE